MGDEQEVLRILHQAKAYLADGHFALVSGQHSDSYVHVRLALAYPEYVSSLGANLADQFRSEQIDVVVGFTLGGVKLAEEVARHLPARVALAARTEQEVAFVEGYAIREGENVLVVDDILTTGGSVQRFLELIRGKTKATVKGIGVVVDRSRQRRDFNVKFVSLARMEGNLWPPASCPKCKEGVPLTPLSLPETDLPALLESLPDADSRNFLLDLVEETYEKWHAASLLSKLRKMTKHRREMPGPKYDRVAVLGKYGPAQMTAVAEYVAKAGYYAVTSTRLYWKGSARRERFGPYSYESMNGFLRRMLYSCQCAIVLDVVAGGQFIETAWCAEANQPTLGIASLKPFDRDDLGNCPFLEHSVNYRLLYCNAFRAVESGASTIGGWICMEHLYCPFVRADLSKMVIDLFATSRTMFLIGSEQISDCEHAILAFILNRGVLRLSDLG